MKTQDKKIEEKLNDPVFMKSVIDMVLDSKNPDSNRLKKEILKNISTCIQKDDAFLTTIKGMCIESSERISQNIVEKCLDEYKEYLTNAIVTTINIQCQEFFEDKKKMVSEMLKEALQKSVDEISNFTDEMMKKTEENLDKISEKKNSNSITIDIPYEHKDEIISFVDFLNSKK